MEDGEVEMGVWEDVEEKREEEERKRGKGQRQTPTLVW